MYACIHGIGSRFFEGCASKSIASNVSKPTPTTLALANCFVRM
jgi:hypothetical protein